MADCLPYASSGPRQPVKRPKPIPKVVKDACLLMIYGDPDDEDGVPMDFICAAKQVGMRPDTLRRYLGRPAVIVFLRAERRAFREAICAGNEDALRRVRDKSPNGMAVIGSVRALEELGDEQNAGIGGANHSPGLTIRIIHQTPIPPTIDITPVPAPAPRPIEHDDKATEPAFKPPSRW